MKDDSKSTHIRVKPLTIRVLNDIKKHWETYDDVIMRCALTQAKRSDIIKDSIQEALDEQERRRNPQA